MNLTFLEDLRATMEGLAPRFKIRFHDLDVRVVPDEDGSDVLTAIVVEIIDSNGIEGAGLISVQQAIGLPLEAIATYLIADGLGEIKAYQTGQ